MESGRLRLVQKSGQIAMLIVSTVATTIVDIAMRK